jgi:hypothetical protein
MVTFHEDSFARRELPWIVFDTLLGAAKIITKTIIAINKRKKKTSAANGP